MFQSWIGSFFFSNSRRGRKAVDRISPVDPVADLKSSSELNLNTASTSVPIRTTRTSRLRAAAANHSDSSLALRKSNRSSSVQSLEDDKTYKPKSSKLLDRDKTKSVTNRRQTHEKENLKSASTTCFPEKEYGAVKSKPKHSINKNILEKDKTNFLASTKGKVDEKSSSKSDVIKLRNSPKKANYVKEDEMPLISVNSEELFNEILGDKGHSGSLETETFEDLFKDVVAGNDFMKNDVSSEIVPDNSRLNHSHKDNIPNEDIDVNKVIVSGEVPKVVKSEEESGLLGVVCVPKVQRFSELLSNLCPPRETDILFEDVLAEIRQIDDAVRFLFCTLKVSRYYSVFFIMLLP